MSEVESYRRLIDQCQELTIESVKIIAERLVIDMDAELEKNIETASSNQMNMVACENAALFHKNKRLIQNHVWQQVSKGFSAFKDNSLDTHIRENDFHNGAWSLLDDDVLEETICISTYSSETNIEHKEKLWQLHQRLSFTKNNTAVDESNNPLSPVQFFAALRFSLKIVPLSITAKLSGHKALANILSQHYASVLNKANALFINEGILPELHYEKYHQDQRKSKSTVAADEKDSLDSSAETIKDSINSINNADHPDTDSSGTSQIPLVNTIRNLLQRARNISNEEVAVPISHKSQKSSHGGGGSYQPSQPNDGIPLAKLGQTKQAQVVFDVSQIVGAVEAVQHSAATAHFFSERTEDADTEVLTVPTNIAENSARIYNHLYESAPDGAINAKNMYTIDMVGMLFEYILADENLPDSIKTLLSHLHTPFLKLAFLDDDFFENKEHKSRMLLDSLAEAGANWVSHDGTSQYDMYNEIKRVVLRAIKEFKNDVNLFAELLMEFNLLKKRVSHMHNLRERNSIEKKQGQEKHDQAKAMARTAIKSRIEGRRVPSSIISLLSPWFTYLTFISLKEGEQTGKWDKALSVLDNLITYCSIKQVKQDTARLSEGFDQIILQVKEGLHHVAYNPAKASAIIEELEELKYSVLNKKTIKTTSTTDSSKTPPNATPIEKNDTPSPEEERVMNYIKLIEPGTWIEYDKTSRLKVNGFNSESRKYILVDQSSQQVIMLTRLQFARDILSEKATVIDGNAKPLFERALERIRYNLDKQVQASYA
jgi:hypothetical protein